MRFTPVLLLAVLLGAAAAGHALGDEAAPAVGGSTTSAGTPAAADTAPAPSPVPPTPDIARNDAGEPLVTNVFADTDLRQALSDVSAQTGVTIIPDATVQGAVSADLRDVPLETALRMLLLSGGYAYRKLDGYYLVGSADPANPNFYLLSETEVVDLDYIDGSAIAPYLSGPYGKYVTLEGAPSQPAEREQQADRNRTGYQRPVGYREPDTGARLFITAPRPVIDRIKADLALMDRPRTQVMLEAVVLEVSNDALREIGIDWATRWVRFASRESSIQNDAAEAGSRISETVPSSSLTYSALSFVEMAKLQALVQCGRARLRANPRVATTEGRSAEIEVGQEKYFAIITGPVTFPYTTLERIPAGITLRITPRVVESRREVIARIEPQVRDVTGQGANGLPEIAYRRAETNVRVRDGESIIIGGLVNEFSSRVDIKVPFLGDIPLIGRLFRRQSSRELKTEVVIIVTPHILDDGGGPSVPVPADGEGRE